MTELVITTKTPIWCCWILKYWVMHLFVIWWRAWVMHWLLMWRHRLTPHQTVLII